MSEITIKDSILAYISTHLSSHRYQHTLGVAAAARDLAIRYSYDPDKAEIAGLLHDVAKQLPMEEMRILAIKAFPDGLDPAIMANGGLLHGYAGVTISKERFHIHDEDIVMAIAHHTTGAVHMSVLEKIIFLADYIEVNRDFPGVNELREVAFENLDKAVLKGFDSTISHLIEQDKPIFIGTVTNRNYLLHDYQCSSKE